LSNLLLTAEWYFCTDFISQLTMGNDQEVE